jgi:hypothetical protein
MAAELLDRIPTLRERFHRPGLDYHLTANGNVPYSERRVPDAMKVIHFPGFCDDPDPNDATLDRFAELNRWLIKFSEPVGKVINFDSDGTIKLKVGDIDAYVTAFQKAIPEGEEVEIIGASQGGVLAVKVAKEIEKRNHVRHVGLVVPGGCMNGHHETTRQTDKKLEMLRRTGGWIAEQGGDAITIFRDEGIASVIKGARTFGHMFSDPLRAIARAREVSDADIIPDVYELIEKYGTLFTVVVGMHDKLLPGEIIQKNIRNRGEIFPGRSSENNPRIIPSLTGHNLKLSGQEYADYIFAEMRETERLAA